MATSLKEYAERVPLLPQEQARQRDRGRHDLFWKRAPTVLFSIAIFVLLCLPQAPTLALVVTAVVALTLIGILISDLQR